MAYGQKNYNEIQGINGKLRINQIGCFLTAFCNLLERFGKGVDPLTLNREFKNRGIYIDVDDGIRDDVSFSSITKFNPNIVITGSGVGRPTSNNSIVKFKYKSATGKVKTHFSLVADAAKGLIVDSWDGQVKSWNTYGGPVAWASYRDNTPKPAPAASPVPHPAPQPVPAPPAPEVVNITVQPGWGITHVLKAAGYSKEQWDNPAEWDRVAGLNGSATRIRLHPNQVVKVYRQALPIVHPAPTVAVAPVAAPVVATAVAEAIAPITEAPKPIENEDGSVLVPVTVIPKDPKAYQETFVPEDKFYIANETRVIKDLDGLHMDLQLFAGQKVHSGGSFEKDGEAFVRTQKHVEQGIWYPIPKSALGAAKDPNAYVGPLVHDTDDDLDDLLDLDLAMEFKEAVGNLSSKEKFVDFLGKFYDSILKLKFWDKTKTT